MNTILSHCTLCPRRCGADRAAGQTGYCGQTADIRVARAALHFWEEPCISGSAGSGTVFFAGCGLRCVFCQNYKIAGADAGRNGYGISLTVSELAGRFLALQDQGAHNINLVTPTHFVPQIVEALKLAKLRGLSLPIVYNTGSYETVETLRLLDGLIDIYLPDMKYCSPELSARYSCAPDYFTAAKAAIAEMYRQVGDPVFETDCGTPLMKRGMIVRHLVLPGRTADSRSVLRYLYETYGDHVFLSILNQYTPLSENPALQEMPELMRTVTDSEYEKIVEFAIELGVENGFIQEGPTQNESFVPAWDRETKA